MARLTDRARIEDEAAAVPHLRLDDRRDRDEGALLAGNPPASPNAPLPSLASARAATRFLSGPTAPGRGFGASRSAMLLALQGTYGNQAVQRLVQRAASAAPPRRQDRQEPLASRLDGAGSGTPLEPAVQQRLEQGLGADLSGVRVHTDVGADQLARDVGAVAFTTGENIFFRSGMYDPSTPDGVRLLAHEATHVIQQSAGPVAGTPGPGGIAMSSPSDAHEQAARATSAGVADGHPTAPAPGPLVTLGRAGGAAGTPYPVQRDGPPAAPDPQAPGAAGPPSLLDQADVWRAIEAAAPASISSAVGRLEADANKAKDTLWGLAVKAYNDQFASAAIYLANTKTVGRAASVVAGVETAAAGAAVAPLAGAAAAAAAAAAATPIAGAAVGGATALGTDALADQYKARLDALKVTYDSLVVPAKSQLDQDFVRLFTEGSENDLVTPYKNDVLNGLMETFDAEWVQAPTDEKEAGKLNVWTGRYKEAVGTKFGANSVEGQNVLNRANGFARVFISEAQAMLDAQVSPGLTEICAWAGRTSGAAAGTVFLGVGAGPVIGGAIGAGIGSATAPTFAPPATP